MGFHNTLVNSWRENQIKHEESPRILSVSISPPTDPKEGASEQQQKEEDEKHWNCFSSNLQKNQIYKHISNDNNNFLCPSKNGQ